MPKTAKKILTGTVICLALYVAWFFFIDTLSFSDLVGPMDDPSTTIVVNLFDFDTDLTRLDVYRLKSKATYWDKRINQVESISDPARQAEEQKILMAEMMEDPSLKKIIRKVSRFGLQAVGVTVRAVKNFN